MPTPLATRPSFVWPLPKCTAIVLSAVPGITHTGISIERPSDVIVMTSSFFTPSFSAVAKPTYATLSHVSFDSGFGSSCIQPLLPNRPSSTVGSGRNTTSKPALAAAGAANDAGAAGLAAAIMAGFSVFSAFSDFSAFASGAWSIDVLAMKPSCSACFQNDSAFANAAPDASRNTNFVFV